MALRALIADDEALARERITALLKTEPDITVAGQCRDGYEAIEAIRRLRPDLLFLDVEMPEVDGFGVLRALDPEQIPVVIFTTAYDHYAVQAFEAHALDYLLKPFDAERFRRALDRARGELAQARSGDLARRLLHMLHASRPAAADRLVIKSGGKVVFLRTAEIEWVEAAANYVCVHTGRESYLLRETMNSFEARLDAERFMRIHRSIIVNLEKIRALQPCNNGEYIVILEDGKELSLSRSYRERLQHYLDTRFALPEVRQGADRPEAL